MRRHLAGMAILVGLALAGCGSSDDGSDSGVASAGGGGAVPSASTAADDADQQLAFAQCMRENGVDVPDPEPGSNRPNFRFGDSDVDRQKAQQALEKCRDKLPNGGQRRQLDAAQIDQTRKLSQCMRENGFPDFPDPGADGNIGFQDLNLDRNDPKLRSALEKCQQYAPDLGRGNG